MPKTKYKKKTKKTMKRKRTKKRKTVKPMIKRRRLMMRSGY